MTEAYDAYMEMVRRVYLSETPAKDHIFADWTEQEIQELINYTGEVADLEARNAEITVEYRALDEEEFDQGMAELYNELVRNNNRIAQIYGYDNYYEYAYEHVYDRDYEHDSIVTMRGYVAQYLIPGISSALYEFNNKMSGLGTAQQMELVGLLYNSYTTLKKDFVGKYLNSIPESASNTMSFLFDQKRGIFTKATNAEQGAFTTDIAGRPYCYFGPGYDNATTVIHELGHFYAAEFTDLNAQPLDLAETHSQSNEWLFIKFLDGEMNKDVYAVLVEYKLYEAIAMIAVCTMVDQFEELVYTHPQAGNLTLEQLNGLMSQVMEEYGGEKFISNNISDMQNYWKMVVVEQPVYYISYAVSSIAALNIFTMSLEDEDAAWDAYIKLAEQMDIDQGFLWNIEQAGLAGPFDENVYQDLVERYE
jgi:oligoendopeptidase F